MVQLFLTVLDLDLSGDQDVYVEPTFPTFPGVDSLARADGKWFAFQITVARAHALDATKIAEHLKNLGVRGPFRIYFVVPKNLYQEYRKQSYEFEGDTNPLDRYDVEQWVLGIDLTPTMTDTLRS